MFEALSATNEAIMRVKTRAELFELVCQAAVLGGKFASATIALAEPDGEFLVIAATKGLTTTSHEEPPLAIGSGSRGQGIERNVVPDTATLHHE